MNRTDASLLHVSRQEQARLDARIQARTLLALLSADFPGDEVEDGTDDPTPWFALVGPSQESVCFTWSGESVAVTLYDGLLIARWSPDSLDIPSTVRWYGTLPAALDAWVRDGRSDFFAHLPN